MVIAPNSQACIKFSPSFDNEGSLKARLFFTAHKGSARPVPRV